MSVEHYECDGCAACCRTFPIFVSHEDAARELRIAAEGRLLPLHLAAPQWDYQLFPLPFHQACCFLNEENRCTIYASRPDVCRRFAAGSPQCQEARADAGLPRLTSAPTLAPASLALPGAAPQTQPASVPR